MNAPIDTAHRISINLTRQIRHWHTVRTVEVDQWDIGPVPDDFDPNEPVDVVPNPLRKTWRLRGPGVASRDTV